MTQQDSPRFETPLTAAELAPHLHLHSTTLRRLARAGRIPHRRAGRRFLFLPSVIETWLREGESVAPEIEKPPEMTERRTREGSREPHPEISLDSMDVVGRCASQVLEITGGDPE